jgi:hypothetical protein
MRYTRLKKIAIILLAFAGLLMLLLAIFAYNLKLDNNPAMGAQRKALALAGLACLAFAAAWLASGRLARLFAPVHSLLQRLNASASQLPLLKGLRNGFQRLADSAPGRLLKRHPAAWAGLGALLVMLVSYWYITSGLWSWLPYTRYFDRQADAFLAGSLALLEKPSPQLLALANPYDYHNRAGIGYLWDSSLYHGHFYLYWGPVPALLAAAAKLIHPGQVEDQHLVMFFLAGLTLMLAALLHWLRKTFFPEAPAWTLLPLTLAGGLSAPLLWLVNRPSVYETAIAGGQFFLILGLYAALRGLAAPSGTGWLVLTGLAWGASVGCRINDAAAVLWLVALTCLYLIYRSKRSLNWFILALCMGLPLLAWAGGLAWYNLARFGSLLETGHRYQLTGPALPADYSLVASPLYILPNLYNYLLRPLFYSWREFPFVYAPNIKEGMWPSFIRLPEHYYYGEPVAGIFAVVPFFWLLILSLLQPLRAAWDWAHERNTTPTASIHPLLPWVCWFVAGALLVSLFSLSFFISSTMRYLADLVPLLTVLSGLSLWSALEFLRERPGWRRLLQAALLVLALLSLIIGLFASFRVSGQRFESSNPALIHALARFFTGQP